jgi:ankyrin repeat protein
MFILLFYTAVLVPVLHAQIFLNDETRMDELTKAIRARDVQKIKKIASKGIINKYPWVAGVCGTGDAGTDNSDAEIVSYLLDLGAAIEAPLKSASGSYTPLAYAAAKGKKKVVTTLLDRGANPTMAMVGKDTVALLLLQNGDRANFDRVLPLIAEIDAIGSKGKTLLLMATDADDPGLIEILVKRGADVNLPMKGVPPLLSAIYGRHFKAAKALIANGADTSQGDSRYTPLTLSLDIGDQDTIKLLVENGANINAEVNGKSLLLSAVEKKDVELVRKLLILGADPNGGSQRGAALLAAISANNIPIATILLENGADSKVNFKGGSTAYNAAWKAGKRELSALLAKYGAVDDTGNKIGDENEYYYSNAIAAGTIEALSSYVNLFPGSPHAKDCTDRIEKIQSAQVAQINLEMQVGVGGDLAPVLADKNLFIEAINSAGQLGSVASFLKGSQLRVISSVSGNTITIAAVVSNFNTNLLVKNTEAGKLDYISIENIISMAKVLELYSAKVSGKAPGIKVEKYLGLERNNNICFFTFEKQGFYAGLGSIMFVSAKEQQQYIIQGTQYMNRYYIPSASNQQTGELQTSSLLYAFFNAMPGGDTKQQ